MTHIDPRMIELDKEVETYIKKKEALEKELAEKKEKNGKTSWKTGARAEQTGEFNIHIQIAKIEKLIPFTAHLLRLKKDWIEACDLLGVPTTEKDPTLLNRNNQPINPAMFKDYPVSDWLDDCKQRITLIEITNLQTKIDKISKAIENTKSEYQKRKDAINEIRNLLED